MDLVAYSFKVHQSNYVTSKKIVVQNKFDINFLHENYTENFRNKLLAILFLNFSLN